VKALGVAVPPSLLARDDEVIDEASFERPTTDPSFADFLDRHSSVLGGRRNLPLVRRPRVATGTDPMMLATIGLLSSPIGTFETCRRTLGMSAYRGGPEVVD
jgi:hypothetical protein